MEIKRSEILGFLVIPMYYDDEGYLTWDSPNFFTIDEEEAYIAQSKEFSVAAILRNGEVHLLSNGADSCSNTIEKYDRNDNLLSFEFDPENRYDEDIAIIDDLKYKVGQEIRLKPWKIFAKELGINENAEVIVGNMTLSKKSNWFFDGSHQIIAYGGKEGYILDTLQDNTRIICTDNMIEGIVPNEDEVEED